MATGSGRLTWQNVTAPDFSGAVEAQRASALAFDSAMQRLGGAVQTFDNNRKDRADAAVMRNALQYQNADELQAAIASGALMQGVNPDHVRVDALLKAQNQAGQLMALEKDRQQLATSQQMYDFNAKYNPLRLEKHGLENTQLGNDIAFTQDARTREAQAREISEQVSNEIAEGFRSGAFQQPGAIAKWVQSAGPVDSPLAQARWQAAIKQVPALAQTFDQMGFGAPAVSPLSGTSGGLTAIGGSAPAKLPEAWASQLSAREEAAGLPVGLLSSVIQQETGGKADFLNDPAKYHYELNKDGKRIAGHTGKVSTAFGPFGILESTAKNPGFGVKPLQNKSIEEQARFASDYLAARIKAAGSVQGGLAGYGEGMKYADAVMSRLNQADTPVSQQKAGAAASQAQLAVVDAANREGVPQNQRYIKAMELGLAGKEDTSLRGTLARHKDAFSGSNQEQLEKLMKEVDQELGGGGNYELAAQFLLDENLSEGNFISNTWDKMFGDGGGRKFDANSVRSRIKSFKERGGFKLYSTAAAGYRANSALENQALYQQAVDDLTKRRDAAAVAAQSGVPGAETALAEWTNKLSELRENQNAQSAATYSGFVPATLQAPPPKETPPAPAPAPTASASGSSASMLNSPENFYSPEATEKRRTANELRQQAQAAAEAKEPTPQRKFVDTSRITQQRELVSKLTTERIQNMSKAEAQEVISMGLFPLLTKEQQKLIRTISRSKG